MADPTEAVLDPSQKATVGFERKLSDGNFGSNGFTHFVPYQVVDGDIEATLDNAAAAALVAKTVVFDQLGIVYEVNETTGVVTEKSVPVVVKKSAAPKAAASNGEYARPQVRGQEGDLPEWFDDQVKAAREKTGRPINAVWDNRAKATGRQPLFKEVVAATDSRKAAGIWAPKEA